MKRGFARRFTMGFLLFTVTGVCWSRLHFGIQGLWGSSIEQVEGGIMNSSFLDILNRLYSNHIHVLTVASVCLFRASHGEVGVWSGYDD